MTGRFSNALRRVALTCAAAALMAFPVAAGVIYSDFGPGGAYDQTLGYGITGADVSPNGLVSAASGFTATASGAVSQIDLAVFSVAGTPSVNVSLWTDVDGALGSELGSGWTASLQPIDAAIQQAPAIVSGITGVNLVAGQTYFVELQPVASDTFASWQNNYKDATGLFCSSLPEVGCSDGLLPTQAFSVLGVPEPGAWALMIAGFALTGAGLRHRRRDVAAA